MSLAEKLTGYRWRVAHEWRQQRSRVADRRRERVFEMWLERLVRQPPEILVGANFAAYGGVRHHIQAIQRYSSRRVALAPSEEVMRKVGAHHVTQDHTSRFAAFSAAGIEVVHSHVYPWFIKWCREQQLRGKRWIHTYHNHYFPEFQRDGKLEPWQVEINDALINVACNADVKLSVSKWQRDQLQRDYGIETIYLPNGVDVIACDRSIAARFVKKTGLKNYVLYVGRNDPVKNPADFVRLAERLPELQFVMIGGGLTVTALGEDWGVEVPTNLCVLGPLPHSDVLDAIAGCSGLVVTSKREGLPTLVMEGMALRRVVLVPDEAGCAEVIGDVPGGFLYKLGNVEELAEKLLTALARPELGMNSRARVCLEYDWRRIINRLDAIYGDIERL